MKLLLADRVIIGDGEQIIEEAAVTFDVEEQLEAGINTGEVLESIIETKLFVELLTIWMDALNELRKNRNLKKSFNRARKKKRRLRTTLFLLDSLSIPSLSVERKNTVYTIISMFLADFYVNE